MLLKIFLTSLYLSLIITISMKVIDSYYDFHDKVVPNWISATLVLFLFC